MEKRIYSRIEDKFYRISIESIAGHHNIDIVEERVVDNDSYLSRYGFCTENYRKKIKKPIHIKSFETPTSISRITVENRVNNFIEKLIHEGLDEATTYLNNEIELINNKIKGIDMLVLYENNKKDYAKGTSGDKEKIQKRIHELRSDGVIGPKVVEIIKEEFGVEYHVNSIYALDKRYKEDMEKREIIWTYLGKRK